MVLAVLCTETLTQSVVISEGLALCGTIRKPGFAVVVLVVMCTANYNPTS